MMYNVDELLSCLQVCYGTETIFVRTPKKEAYAVNGFEMDDYEDIILLTEKMGE